MLGAIQKIGEPCQSVFNAGFLTHLYAVKTKDVVYVYDPTGEGIYQPNDAIGILPGSEITEFVIRPKTATFSETKSESVDGDSFLMQLAVPIKGAATDLTTWVHRNSMRRFIVLTRDTLGNCYLIGSFGNGLRMGWNRQVGSISAHQLTFSLVNWHPAQFIATVDLDALFPDSEFDYSFDLSFS